MSFEQFAQAAGLLLDRAIPDGRIHRTPTVSKPRHRNGSYKFDGVRGWAIAWDASEDVAIYRESNPDPGIVLRAKQEAREDYQARQREYMQAAERAAKIVSAATYTDHRYFARKGLAGEKGLVGPDGRLVVPMRNWRTQMLQSVQWISEDGEKKFMPKGKASFSVFAIGPRQAPAWLCEGYATGLSIKRALERLYRNDQVVVCFSAHNLQEIGKAVGQRGYVVADHDRPNPMTGLRAGQEAAKATGLPFVMSTIEGEDFNDFCTRAGLDAGASLLRQLL